MEDDDVSLPFKILFWRVLIKPIDPITQTKGGILLPEDIQEVQSATAMVGRIVDMGAFAFTARTSLGYNYADEPNKPKVGSWVVIPKYGSRDIKLRDGRSFKLVEDYEILAAASRPEELMNYV